MLRAIAACLLPLLALGQVAPPEDPFQTALKAFRPAQNEGRHEDAARHRGEARRLLAKIEANAPQFATSATQLAQIYSEATMTIEARTILEGALERVDPVHPARVALLNALADAWEEDHSLLKSLSYREQAVAALDAIQSAPPGGLVRAAYPRAEFSGRFQIAGDGSYTHQRLAELYRKLGRPDAAAKLSEKMRELAKDDHGRLATLAEQEGRTDDAVALYRKLADQLAAKSQPDPYQMWGAFQSMARVYQSAGRSADAVAVLREGVAALQSSKPEVRNQTLEFMQQNLAAALKKAGDLEGAEQIHQQAVAQATPDRRLRAVMSYADFLGETGRASQGLQLLTDSFARGTGKSFEETAALFVLADLARRAGDTKLASEYRNSAFSKAPPSRAAVAPYFQKATAAANAGRIDESFALALEGMNAAWNAPDRELVVGFVLPVANALANQKQDEKAGERAQQLFDRLFVLVDGWSDQTRRPQIEAAEAYVRFLLHPDRREKANAAVEKYREVLMGARGPETGWVVEALQFKLQLADQREDPVRRLTLARELLSMEESLSGRTSERYLRALQLLANAFQNGGDPAGALPLWRQGIVIADLVFEKGDSARGYARADTAHSLARLGRFDEAERIVKEAMAIELRPAQPDLFRPMWEQIQQTKRAAATRP